MLFRAVDFRFVPRFPRPFPKKATSLREWIVEKPKSGATAHCTSNSPRKNPPLFARLQPPKIKKIETFTNCTLCVNLWLKSVAQVFTTTGHSIVVGLPSCGARPLYPLKKLRVLENGTNSDFRH